MGVKNFYGQNQVKCVILILRQKVGKISMDTKVKLENNINELDNSFKELISTEKLNINSIETLP